MPEAPSPTPASDADSRENGSDVRKGLQTAKKQEVYFAFCFGGEGDPLIVQKRAIKTGDAKELKKRAGGKLVMGTCKFQDGVLKLKVEKGPDSSNVGKEMRRVIKNLTQLSWKVEVGEGGPDTEEEDGAQA